MEPHPCDYGLFLKFIEKFSAVGYEGIDLNDTLIVELDKQTKDFNQFFFIADLIKVKILWTSSRSLEMIGVDRSELNPYHFFEATHPDDLQRHGNGRSKMFNLANDLYTAEQGRFFLSTNLRIRNHYGYFSDLLFQLYLFYCRIPYKTVYLFQVCTNLDSFAKRKQGYHYYVGNDFSNFKYPDEELLKIGHPFSSREFEIIKLIKGGFTSEQIGEKLFLSVHTVNTHRKNILSKAGMKNVHDLIDNLVTQGVF